MLAFLMSGAVGALAVLALSMGSGRGHASTSTTKPDISTTTSTITTAAITSTTRSTETSTPSTSVLTRWCGLNLGDSRQQVEGVLGTGIEVTQRELKQMGLPATYSAERWPNENGFLLLATWDGTSVTALQAYPYGSGVSLPCKQFRVTP